MVSDVTDPNFHEPSSDIYTEDERRLNEDYAAAIAEYNQLMERLAPRQGNKSPFDHFEMYEAPGVGNYVIMKKPGWKELADLIGYDYQKHGDYDSIKAKATIFANIDFSANVYPAFDGILGDHFQSPYLLDPLDDKYESYKNLRDNIAAVRNFLLQSYFANPPEGLTAEKAREKLAEIAGFVGDGLYNNWLLGGVLPYHNPNKPFIDLTEARKPNGKGAQYIYEKILEHQKHSSWLRPFDAVKELFGGKAHPDWQLPGADATHFRDVVFKTVGTVMGDAAALEAARSRIAAIESQLGGIRDARALSTTSADLDAIGNHLLYTAEHMEQGVAHLDKPVRERAVDIARDILNKLKLSLGGKPTMDGLGMKPSEDMATLGAIKGVATVFEKLLAWARSNNDAAIFQHPSVQAATRAIGEMGVLAKLEALRMAEAAGNHVMVGRIREQLARIPEVFKPAPGTRFSDLFEAIESGLNTILYRTQEVSVTGAKVGFSRENTLGQNLSNAPTAGIANQVSAHQASERNAQVAQADQLAAMAEAHKIHAQMAATSRSQQPQQSTTNAPQQQAAQAPAPARGSATVGRAALRSAQNQQRANASKTNITSSATPQANLTPAQQMQAARNATQAATAQASREREEQLKVELQRQQQQQLQARQQAQKATAAALAKTTAQNLPPDIANALRNSVSLKGITGAPVLTGRAALNQKIQAEIQAKTAGAVTPPTNPATIAPMGTNPADPLRNPYVTPPIAPKPSTPGRGF